MEWYTIILVSVISAFTSFALLRVVLEGLRWLDRRKPFTVRPIPGGFSGAFVVAAGEPLPTEPTTVYARLEVQSARFLRDCSVTVVGMWAVDRSRLMKLAQDPQILRWTNGNDTKQDLTPGVPRTIDVAALNQRNKPGHFQIMRVEHKYPPGWYRVELLVASESEQKAIQRVNMAIGLGVRKDPPPPLAFRVWRDGDEKRLKS